MKRTATAVALLLLFVAWGLRPSAQVASIEDDPYHERILYTQHVRVYDVHIPPGVTTLDHPHDRDVVTVALRDGSSRAMAAGGDWRPARSRTVGSAEITEYTGAPVVHRVENVGSGPYRVFAFENLRESGWLTPRIVEAPGTTLVEESRSFAVYEVRLDEGTPETSHVHEMPTVVLLLSGAVDVQGGGGETPFRLAESGRWFPSMMGQPHTLRFGGAGAVHVVEVEAR